MKYTVVWLKSAQNQLAGIWTEADDQQSVADASNALDSQLSIEPRRFSESRGDQGFVQFRDPLGIGFDVSDADRLVTVYAV